jgi:hypothetical protein
MKTKQIIAFVVLVVSIYYIYDYFTLSACDCAKLKDEVIMSDIPSYGYKRSEKDKKMNEKLMKCAEKFDGMNNAVKKCNEEN